MNLTIGISGASGAIYGIKILEELRKQNLETDLVISSWGAEIISHETKYSLKDVKALAARCHKETDLSACISSGTYPCDGMIIAPCSMKTLSGIAHGYADNLLIRAADVTLKEGRKLLLLVRETPLSPIHLENMLSLSRLGVIIMPPVPAFYMEHQTVDDLITQTVGRVLDQFGIEAAGFRRWRAPSP